jgi:cytoskeletal protein RodZ
MTNQNPASSQPLDGDLLTKLNAHADRSLDRLFIDIDELLSGDLEAEPQSPQPNHFSAGEAPPTALSATNYRTETESDRQYHNQAYIPQSDRFSPQLTAELDPPQPSKAKPKKAARRIPFWLKAVLGVGVGSIAIGSSLVWLVTERKITIPQNIDTSWLPFQSKPQVSPEDAKFADYMRKSISKIESTKIATTAAITYGGTTANEIPTTANPTISSAAPAPTPFNPAIANAPIAATPAAIEKPISLVKTIQNSEHPSAIFQVDQKNQPIKLGQKIGTSNWSLVNISKSEVTIKRKGGEIRSIKIGQKF